MRNRIDRSAVVTTFNNLSDSHPNNKKSLSNYETNYAMKKNKSIVIIKKPETKSIPGKYKNYENKIITSDRPSDVKKAITKITTNNSKNKKSK